MPILVIKSMICNHRNFARSVNACGSSILCKMVTAIECLYAYTFDNILELHENPCDPATSSRMSMGRRYHVIL